MRIGDESRCPVTGDELAELLQGAVLDVDPSGGEDDVVGISGDDVGDFVGAWRAYLERIDWAPR